MRKINILAILLFVPGLLLAQPQNGGKGKPMEAERKFQILVKNESRAQVVERSNNMLQEMREEARSEEKRGLLGDLLKTSFGTAFVQKTTNATSNLFSLGVSYLTQAFSSDFDKWQQCVTKENTYTKKLSSETVIDDFYALPSTKGAMDPENIRFQGFGCRNFLELKERAGEGSEVFYIFCKLRRDAEGLQHITNHSKFLVDIDTIMFNPSLCNLPNDSTGSNKENRFDFNKRRDLTLEIKARIFSSWMTETTTVMIDQQLGEFTISLRLNKDMLNADGIFIYDKTNPKHKDAVSLTGDCFVVPRSFTGTTNATNYEQAWGTGQYRIEMELSERCEINETYYGIQKVGNGYQVNQAMVPGEHKTDKKIWKTEWKEMKKRQKGKSFLSNAWTSIVTAYKGDGWVKTFTDPLATALYTYETQKLYDWLDINAGGNAMGAAGMSGAMGAAGAAGAKTGAAPAGTAAGNADSHAQNTNVGAPTGNAQQGNPQGNAAGGGQPQGVGGNPQGAGGQPQK